MRSVNLLGTRWCTCLHDPCAERGHQKGSVAGEAHSVGCRFSTCESDNSHNRTVRRCLRLPLRTEAVRCQIKALRSLVHERCPFKSQDAIGQQRCWVMHMRSDAASAPGKSDNSCNQTERGSLRSRFGQHLASRSPCHSSMWHHSPSRRVFQTCRMTLSQNGVLYMFAFRYLCPHSSYTHVIPTVNDIAVGIVNIMVLFLIIVMPLSLSPQLVSFSLPLCLSLSFFVLVIVIVTVTLSHCHRQCYGHCHAVISIVGEYLLPRSSLRHRISKRFPREAIPASRIPVHNSIV